MTILSCFSRSFTNITANLYAFSLSNDFRSIQFTIIDPWFFHFRLNIFKVLLAFRVLALVVIILVFRRHIEFVLCLIMMPMFVMFVMILLFLFFYIILWANEPFCWVFWVRLLLFIILFFLFIFIRVFMLVMFFLLNITKLLFLFRSLRLRVDHIFRCIHL